MPDIRAILKARNVSDDIAEAMIANPAYTAILEGFVADAENGKTALLKAQEIETNLKKWNDETITPYVRKADEKVAETQGELARTRAYLKTLKDAGYEISDALLGPSTDTPPPPKPAGIDQTYVDTRANDIARTNMALISMAERHRDLTGKGLDVEAEYEDFKKQGRPNETVRDYIGRKYDHAGIQATKEAAEKKKYEDALRAEERKAVMAEYEQKHGSNPETRIPQSSKHDKFREIAAERKDSWNTVAGRDAATQARQEKYADLLSRRQSGSVQ